MRIITVIPTATRAFCDEYVELLRPYLLQTTELSAVPVEAPLPDLEYYYYGALTAVGIIEKMKEAQEDGFDAAIIGCFYDTALREAREVLTFPVIGPGEVTFHHAAMTGEAIGVVVGRQKMFSKLRENAKSYGIADKIVAWESSDLTVQDLRLRNEDVYARLHRACSKALERRAEVLVLACGSMAYYADRLASDLQCPVLNPRLISIKYAELQADLYRRAALTHSKLGGYETPPITSLQHQRVSLPR